MVTFVCISRHGLFDVCPRPMLHVKLQDVARYILKVEENLWTHLGFVKILFVKGNGVHSAVARHDQSCLTDALQGPIICIDYYIVPVYVKVTLLRRIVSRSYFTWNNQDRLSIPLLGYMQD